MSAREFRKKPPVVLAEQWFHGKKVAGVCWCARPHPPAINATETWNPHIHTLEGISYDLAEGDWVITGVKGERYPCKPDVFAATQARRVCCYL